MDYSFEEEDLDDCVQPWALGDDDEPEALDRWDVEDDSPDADRWLDEQLGLVPPSQPRPDDAGEADPGDGAACGDVAVLDADGVEVDSIPVEDFSKEPLALSQRSGSRHREVVLRQSAPARPPRRRRADPDGIADLPAATVPGYVRDRRGTWRYSATGQAVPGARDLTLRSLYRFPVHRGQVMVQVRRVRSEEELAWCLAWQRTLTTQLSAGHVVTVLRVPVEEWERRADIPFGLWAPELTPPRLLGVADVARLARVSPATITAYLSRGRMPPPVTRLGNSPVWSRPVIHQWLVDRPGQGVRPDPVNA